MVRIHAAPFVKGGSALLYYRSSRVDRNQFHCFDIILILPSLVPSVPQNVSATSTGSTSVSVTWMEPAVFFREHMHAWYIAWRVLLNNAMLGVKLMLEHPHTTTYESDPHRNCNMCKLVQYVLHQYDNASIAFPSAHNNNLTTYEVRYRGVDSPNDVNDTFYGTVTVPAGMTQSYMNLSYDILGLMAYSAYNVSVRATNQYGVGDFSEDVTVQTAEGG